MNQKDYFILGSKLLGIYCLVLSFSSLIRAIESLFVPFIFPKDYYQANIIIEILSWLFPTFYIAAGIYLIRDSSSLYNWVYQNKPAIVSDLAKKFILFQKFLGLYLLITSLPDFLKVVSNLVLDLNAPKYWAVSQEQQEFVYLNIFPSIATIFLGFYLLRDGRLFLKWGFGSKSAKPDSDRNNEKGTNE